MINQIANMVVGNQVSFDDAEKQINAVAAAMAEPESDYEYQYEFNDFGVNALAMVDNSPRPGLTQQNSAVASLNTISAEDVAGSNALKGASSGSSSSSVSGIGNRPGQQNLANRSGAGSGWGGGSCWKCDRKKVLILSHVNSLYAA